MALSTREMLLVIRARDEASRVLGRLASNMKDLDKGALAAATSSMARGGALVSLGAGITALGAAGINYLNDTVDAASAYEQATRKTLTQTDNVKVSLEQLKKLGRDVGRDIPASFDQMQESLYTIFSTIDTDMPGAEKLLRAFAKASVAGQTDINTATQGGLQALNAFGLGVEGVTRVNDVMFRLVQKGVGTYEQFVSSLGKAGPSAKRAGQDIESLAGMMAFLTRNGLSTSMASTSAARALDLISNSKVDKRLQDFGVAVRDANGEFRPMADIITDLGNKMANFTAPERAKALEDLFKGSGNNVQARRFFDLAIPGFQQLNSLTGSMQNSAGAMDKAYKIMFDSPQSKVQLLTNKYKAMTTEIGDQLLPIKLKLVEALSSLLGWWEKIPGPVQKAIVIFAAVASGLMVLIGVVTIFAGVLLILEGALALFGTTLAAVFWPITLIIAAIIAIGAAVYFIIKYWDNIVAATKTAWNWIVDKFHTVVDAIKGFFSDLWGHIKNIWNGITDWIGKKVADIVLFFTGLWDAVKTIWGNITDWIGNAVDSIGTFFSELPGKILDFFAALPKRAAYAIGFFVGETIRKVQELVKWFQELPGRILNFLLDLGKSLVTWAITTFVSFRDAAIQKGTELIQWFQELPGRVLNFLVGLGKSLATWAISTFTTLRDNAIQKGTEFIQWFQALPGRVMAWLQNFATEAGQWAINLLTSIVNGAQSGGDSLIQWFKDLPGKLLAGMVDLATGFLQIGGDLINGLWQGIKNAWNGFWSWVGGLFDSFIQGIKDGLGVASPSTIFAQIGGWLLEGFLNGLKAAWDMVWGWLTGFAGRVLQGFVNAGSWLLSVGTTLLNGFLNGVKAGWNFVVSWLQAAPGNIVRNLGNMGSLLVSAGSDLLSGLWNGISGAASWLKGKIMSWAGSILPGWVKDILGIHSPSTVFAEIGMYTMQGFALGIDRGTVSAVESAVSAAYAVSDAFNNNVGLNDPSFSNYANGYVSAGTDATGSSAGGGNTGTPGRTVVPITIHTQEINPLQHAQELGDLIANRVG
jgi:TP901 family phage tail tape measure protein